MLSAQHIEEFFVPYTSRLLREFGGGYVHFCGSNPHLYQALLSLPECRGLNFGNPERFAPEDVLHDCQEAGLVYYGGLRYQDTPPAEEQFRRLWQALRGRKRGLLYQHPRENDPVATVSLWRDIQRTADRPEIIRSRRSNSSGF